MGLIDDLRARQRAERGNKPSMLQGLLNYLEPNVAIKDEQDRRNRQFLGDANLRSANNMLFDVADFANAYANAGIRDVDYFTGGGLSGGTYDPYQFGSPTQDLADLTAGARESLTGVGTVDPETVSPDTQHLADLEGSIIDIIPMGWEDVARGPLRIAQSYAKPGSRMERFLSHHVHPTMEKVPFFDLGGRTAEASEETFLPEEEEAATEVASAAPTGPQVPTGYEQRPEDRVYSTDYSSVPPRDEGLLALLRNSQRNRPYRLGMR